MSKPRGLFGPLSHLFFGEGRFRERVREQEMKIGIGTETKGRRSYAGREKQRNETFRKTEEGGPNGRRLPESPGHAWRHGLREKTNQGRENPMQETAGTRPFQPVPRNPSHLKVEPESTGLIDLPGRNRETGQFSPAHRPAGADPRDRQKPRGHPSTALRRAPGESQGPAAPVPESCLRTTTLRTGSRAREGVVRSALPPPHSPVLSRDFVERTRPPETPPGNTGTHPQKEATRPAIGTPDPEKSE